MKKKSRIQLAWGAIGLFLTHSVITLYTAILCFIYLLVFIKKIKKQKSVNYISNQIYYL